RDEALIRRALAEGGDRPAGAGAGR
ncbi:MAG: hypothetical protein QOJ27_70, partial [Sphingomonadales bacterium]|nr:hypothetical protein [Sphingomonadales bacterium]